MKTKPELGIKNPYALDDKQFTAAVDLLKAQNAQHRRVLVGLPKEMQAFKTGDTVIGTTWQIIANLAAGREGEGRGGAAERGRHRLVGHLDGRRPRASTRPAPTSGWTTSSARRSNAEVAEWFGEAPANSKSCAETADKSLLRHVPRRRRGLLRPGLVLEHADRPVPRRPHRRHVQGLRRVDDGLAGDQGLTMQGAGGRDRAEGLLQQPAPASEAAAGAAAGAADAGAGRGLPRRARRPPALRVLEHRRLHRGRRAHVHDGQLPRGGHATTPTGPSSCARCWSPRR